MLSESSSRATGPEQNELNMRNTIAFLEQLPTKSALTQLLLNHLKSHHDLKQRASLSEAITKMIANLVEESSEPQEEIQKQFAQAVFDKSSGLYKALNHRPRTEHHFPYTLFGPQKWLSTDTQLLQSAQSIASAQQKTLVSFIQSTAESCMGLRK